MDPVSLYMLALKVGASAMAALWVASIGKHDASLVDLWWAPGFAAASLLVWMLSGAPAGSAQVAILAIVLLWAGRMTLLFLRRRRRHPGEDPRYAELRAAWGRGFWWKSLFVVFLLQAGLQWLIALAPMAALAGAPAALGPIGVLGVAVALGGIALETVADAQLDRHKAAGGPALCMTGLRAHLRYPNYLGESLVWWGVWLVAAGAGAAWTVFSPILVTLLLAKVSGAPILDARLAGRPGAEAWARRTPRMLPRPVMRVAWRVASALRPH